MMRKIILGFVIFGIVSICGSKCACSGEKKGIEVVKNGEGFSVKENGQDVLFYQLKAKSQDGKYERLDYVHPLYGLDGEVLTEDFPADHPHHRGIFWGWHQCYAGGKRVGDGWAIENFEWELKKGDYSIEKDGSAVLKAEVVWKSAFKEEEKSGKKAIVREETAVTIHPKEGEIRKIDFAIKLTAINEPVQIGGSEDAGYGGFSVRIKQPEDLRFLAASGEVKAESGQMKLGRWVDFSGSLGGKGKSGVLVLQNKEKPGGVWPWILRQKMSMQNPVYPGREPVSITKDKPVELRYRVIVHKGELSAEMAEKLLAEYDKGK